MKTCLFCLSIAYLSVNAAEIVPTYTTDSCQVNSLRIYNICVAKEESIFKFKNKVYSGSDTSASIKDSLYSRSERSIKKRCYVAASEVLDKCYNENAIQSLNKKFSFRKFEITEIIGKGAATQQGDENASGSALVEFHYENYYLDWTSTLTFGSIVPLIEKNAEYARTVLSPTTEGYSFNGKLSWFPFRLYETSYLKRAGLWGNVGFNPSLWKINETNESIVIGLFEGGLSLNLYDNINDLHVEFDSNNLPIKPTDHKQVVANFGTTNRFLAGDCVYSTCLDSALGNTQRVYPGLITQVMLKYNNMSISTSYVYLFSGKKHINGLTDGQLIGTFAVSSPFYSKISEKKVNNTRY